MQNTPAPPANTAAPAAEAGKEQRQPQGQPEARANIGAAPLNPALATATPEPRKKYCRFKRAGIRYIDYKDPDFLLKFVNDQGKILPRRLTGTSLKFQRRLGVAIKRARHLALLPFVTDSLK